MAPIPMKDLFDSSDSELDALLLAQVEPGWQKVASIIGKMVIVMKDFKTRDDERLTQRVIALVDAGILEGAGNLRRWRFSEVRWPTEMEK
jgi:hypothetical protein